MDDLELLTTFPALESLVVVKRGCRGSECRARNAVSASLNCARTAVMSLATLPSYESGLHTSRSRVLTLTARGRDRVSVLKGDAKVLGGRQGWEKGQAGGVGGILQMVREQ